MLDLEKFIAGLPWSPLRRIPTKSGIRVVCDTPWTPDVAAVISDREVQKRFGLNVSVFMGIAKLSRWRNLNADEVAELNSKIAASCATDSDIEIPCPAGLAYLPYQRAGIAFSLAHTNTLIADEPGLGKTPQSIGVINALPSIQRVLIVVPASLKINWRRELNRWLVRETTIGLADGKKWPTDPVVVINFENIAKQRENILKIDWDLLIIDEAHVLKNPETKRARSILGYRPPMKKAKKMLEAILGCAVTKEILNDRYEALCQPAIFAKRKIFLTGTPISNRPSELFPLVNALVPAEFPSFMNYAKRYCEARKFFVGDKECWDFKGSSNLEELQQKLRVTCMVRRKKEDVLAELPPKRRFILELPSDGMGDIISRGGPLLERYEETTARIKQLQDRATAAGSAAAFASQIKALSDGASVAFEEMSLIRHELAQRKLPLVVDRLNLLIDDNPEYKVIVFAHHRDLLLKLRQEFSGNSVMILGGMSIEEKDAAVQAFQNDASKQIFFGQIEAAGVGLTLTASSHVIMVEDHWVPGMVTQCEDRAHRVGQLNSVLVEHLVFEGSIDVKIIKDLFAKQEIIDQALDNPKLFVVKPSTNRQGHPDRGHYNLTPAQVSAVQEGLKLIASYCDGARALDRAGFNGVDTYIGKKLAPLSTLSPKQAALGFRLCAKYRGQLTTEIRDQLFPQAVATSNPEFIAASGPAANQSGMALTAA